MGEWKRLTAIDGHPVDVSMDPVAFIECPQGVTELHFINDAGAFSLSITELTD